MEISDILCDCRQVHGQAECSQSSLVLQEVEVAKS